MSTVGQSAANGRRRSQAAAVPVAMAAAVALAGCAGTSAPRDPVQATSRAIPVQVSVSNCGKGWHGGPAGPVDLLMRDTDSRSGSVDLLDPRTKWVYASVESLGAGGAEALRANLGAGRYQLRCSMEDETSVYGPIVTLTGTAKGDTPAVEPVDQAALLPAVANYQQYVQGKLPGVLRLVERVAADVRRGDLARARRDWLPAHLAYQRLGAAYGAFGTADTRINGLAAGLPRGVDDPSFTGFHRLEYGLWHAQTAAELRPVAAGLVSAVRTLKRTFPNAQIDPLDIGLRAHEITEDTLRFALTGEDDYGSHSGLATVRADLDGTKIVLGAVDGLLSDRYPGLPHAYAQLRLTERDLDALRAPDGTWPPLDSLSRTQRERVDSYVSELAELLAPVAMVLQPRREK